MSQVITKERLTELSNEYLRTLSHLSRLKEIAIKMEKDFEEQEKKTKVLDPIVDTYNRDKNKKGVGKNESSQE